MPFYRFLHKRSLLFALFLLTLAISVCGAQDQDPNPPQALNEDDVWQISADHILYDQADESYLAEGNVSIVRGGRVLNADRVRLNRTTQEAVAEGNVQLTSDGDRLTGDQLSINLETKQGTLMDGLLYLEENHLYIYGEEIRKTGENTYVIDGARVTSCDDPRPAWSLNSSEVKVTLEGYATARHTALRVKGFPVLYTPYLIFPAKRERQSGLLMPEFGTSQRKGEEVLQPLYWAIDDSSDATIYGHYMSRRGLRGGLEYRYILSPESMGVLIGDGFMDRQVDDGTDAEAADRYGYPDDNATRPNEDRYWIRAKADQDLPAGLRAKLDIDIVSDQDYLHEFRSGMLGYKETENDFLSLFGRDLDPYDDAIRDNRLNISRLWPHYAFNGDLLWRDNVIARRQDLANPAIKHLPALRFDGLRQRVAGSPLFLDFASSYIYNQRDDGVRGHRADLHPRLNIPLFPVTGLVIEPSAGVRQTYWNVEDPDAASGQEESDYHRTVYDFKIDMNSEFFRVFSVDVAGQDRLKHTLLPEITYEYVPEVDQRKMPLFDSTIDRIERTNRITYALTQTLTTRAAPATAARQRAYAYVTFLRFKLLQSYRFETYETQEDEPFSNIQAELDITPAKYVYLDSDAAWSPYDAELTSFNSTLVLWDARGDRLSGTYRYTRDADADENLSADGLETVTLAALLNIDRRWAIRTGYEYNLRDELEIESSFGLTYKSQCWAVDLDQVNEEGDRSITVMFHLLGLGSIGN